MSGPTVDAKIRLGAQFDSALQALRGLRKEVVGVSDAAAKPGPKPFPGLQGGLTDVGRQLATVRQQVLAFIGLQVGAEGVRALAQMSDGYAGMSARLRIATQSQAEYAQALATTRDIARQYQQPLADTATLYTRMLTALRPLGGGLREADVATQAMLASLKISGASAAEAGSAILQFSQALSAGALRGEEFNSIAEASPRLLDALAAGLGKPRGELKLLAEQGQLTTAAIVGALQNQLPQLQREAATIPRTIGGAMQSLKDSVFALVGGTTEGSRGIKLLTDAITALANNIKPLVEMVLALGLAFAAFKLGALVSSFIGWAGAIGTVAGVLPALLTGLRAVLALVGGPVGLVVAIGSLVAGWLALGSAKAKVTERTVAQVQAERDAVQAERDKYAEELKRVRFKAPSAVASLHSQDAQLRRLDDEIALLRQKQDIVDETRRMQAKADAQASGANNLRDPATIKAFQDDYKIRADIVKKFEQERLKYTLAIDQEISAAQAKGNGEAADKLAQDRTAYLLEQKKAERDALRKFAADETNTRTAQYKEQYDRIAEVVADGTARDLRLNQSLYDERLRSSKEYFAQRTALEEDQAAQALAKLETELAAKRKVLARNQALLAKAPTANERQGLSDAVEGNAADVARVEVQLVQAGRDRAEAARVRRADEAATTRELTAQQLAIELQTRELRGQLTLADTRARIEAKYAEDRRREKAETGGTTKVDALIDAEVAQATFDKVEQAYGQMLTRLQLEVDALNLAAEAGTITRWEAERDILALRDQQLPKLREEVKLMSDLAVTPEQKNRAAGADNTLKQKYVDLSTDMEKTARSSGAQALSGLFTDIATGAKSAKDAVKDALSSMAKAMLDLVAKRLGEQLINSMFGASGGANGAQGNGGGWMQAIGSVIASFFHTGGVVGSGGQAARGVSPLAWAGAPRYHSGGVVGLRPNERAIVALDGEEMLTADDPRHRKNFKGGGRGDVNISVTVEGASGNDTEKAGAGNELARMVEAVVDRWAIKQSAEGGVLWSGGRR